MCERQRHTFRAVVSRLICFFVTNTILGSDHFGPQLSPRHTTSHCSATMSVAKMTTDNDESCVVALTSIYCGSGLQQRVRDTRHIEAYRDLPSPLYVRDMATD